MRKFSKRESSAMIKKNKTTSNMYRSNLTGAIILLSGLFDNLDEMLHDVRSIIDATSDCCEQTLHTCSKQLKK